MEQKTSGLAAAATHYQACSEQPIEVMQEKFSIEQMEGFLLGNLIKYIMRYGLKDDTRKEAEKILQYAMWLVDLKNGRKIDVHKNEAEERLDRMFPPYEDIEKLKEQHKSEMCELSADYECRIKELVRHNKRMLEGLNGIYKSLQEDMEECTHYQGTNCSSCVIGENRRCSMMLHLKVVEEALGKEAA